MEAIGGWIGLSIILAALALFVVVWVKTEGRATRSGELAKLNERVYLALEMRRWQDALDALDEMQERFPDYCAKPVQKHHHDKTRKHLAVLIGDDS